MLAMMSMGYHAHPAADYEGAEPSLLDYFTDDRPSDTSGNNGADDVDDDDVTVDGDGEESGISNASFNSDTTNDNEQQSPGDVVVGSNDAMTIAIDFIGDDDETVPAIVELGMDVSQGIEDSTTTSGNSNSSSGTNAETSLVGSTSASNSDGDDLNSISGISDSTSTDDSSVVTDSNASTSNSDNESSNASTNVSSVSGFDGTDISEFISTGGSETSSSSTGITNNSGSSNPNSGRVSSSTNTIPLTLAERKSIIESKCQLSIHARSQAIISLLGSFVSSPELTLVTQGGPHYEAFVWLVHLDDAILCPPPAATDDEMMRQRIVQRYTLATLYYAMNGDEWTTCSSSRNFFDDSSTETGVCNDAVRFLDASHECNWYGISCVGDGPYDVDSYHAIDEIVLPNNNLSGAIPTEFYNAFERLRVWNMEKNGGVIGSLSNGVGRLTELEVLVL
jgi:hypothetical protein